MNTLYIIRGLPGSGKSTLANTLAGTGRCEADEYFTNALTGEYTFDASKIKDAHDYCKMKAARLMEDRVTTVAVANTFTRRWEYEPYITIAQLNGYNVIIISLESEFDSVHGVPTEMMDIMRKRFEHNFGIVPESNL